VGRSNSWPDLISGSGLSASDVGNAWVQGRLFGKSRHTKPNMEVLKVCWTLVDFDSGPQPPHGFSLVENCTSPLAAGCAAARGTVNGAAHHGRKAADFKH
jgi:hypothetical protein